MMAVSFGLLDILRTQPEPILAALVPDCAMVGRLACVCRVARAAVLKSSVWHALCVRRKVIVPGTVFSGAAVATDDTTLTPEEARRLLQRDLAFGGARFAVICDCTQEGTEVMTQDYLACIVTSTKDKSISVASYRTLGPATCVRLPDPLAQPLGVPFPAPDILYALPSNHVLIAHPFDASISTQTLSLSIFVCDLSVLSTAPATAFHMLATHRQNSLCPTFFYLPEHPLSRTSPVFVCPSYNPATGAIVVDVFTVQLGPTPALRSLCTFPLPSPFTSLLGVVCLAAPSLGPFYAISGHQGDTSFVTHVAVLTEAGAVVTTMVKPVSRFAGDTWTGVLRSDGMAALLFPRMQAPQHELFDSVNFAELYHFSVHKPGEAPQIVSSGVDYLSPCISVPSAITSTPLIFGCTPGAGKAVLIDPFDVIAPTADMLTAAVGVPPAKPVPMLAAPRGQLQTIARVVHAAPAPIGAHHGRRIVLRGRYALIALDATVSLFDLVAGEYLWCRPVRPGNLAVQSFALSPDGCALYASLPNDTGVFMALDRLVSKAS